MTTDNAMRWRFTPGFYEVWYATVTHKKTGDGFWLRHTLRAPTSGHGTPECAIWFARSTRTAARSFGVHRKQDIAELHSESDPFEIGIASNRLRNDGVSGAIEGAGHRARWQLAWRPAEKSRRILPSFSYGSRLTETTVLSPNFSVAVTGSIEVDGETYVFDGERLGQSHLWGKKHAYAWAWAHINTFSDPEVALEALIVRLRRGPIVLPQVPLLSLSLHQRDLEFREPYQWIGMKSSFATGQFAIRARDLRHVVELEIEAPPEILVRAEYADPDGDAAWCHHTECARAKLTVTSRGLFQPTVVEKFETEFAHAEWAARAGDARVRIIHSAV